MLAIAAANAQAPGLINYQAVARNTATGLELVDQNVFVVFKILEGGPQGNIVYQEQHNVETNAFGLFSVQIGGGSSVAGNFNGIDWGAQTHWLEVDIDAGSGLETVGTMQLISVPYALHAGTVDNADDADADPTNEYVQSFDYNSELNTLNLVDGGGSFSVPLDNLAGDDDPDPTNELIDSFGFDPGTGELTLVEAGTAYSANLSPLLNDADADPNNELNTQLSFDSQTATLSLSDPGSTLEVNLGSLSEDADADPENELITDLDLSEDGIFTITEDGNTISEDLSSLIDDDDADPSNELISSLVLSAEGELTITEGGSSISTDLSGLIDDADADITNELIDENGLTLINDSILSISEGGVINLINLGPVARERAWKISDSGSEVYNTEPNVGIGTSAPAAKLEVNSNGDDSIELLRIKTSESEPIIQVGQNSVGVFTDNAASTFEVHGSIGYGATILSNAGGFVNYDVTDRDHIIICKLESLIFNAYAINMPDPATCEGRVITIRKTGPGSLISFVSINFDGAELDYGGGDIIITGNSRRTLTFISMGADGWTELYNE